jgi:AAA+ superfamily predicted ATPase
MSQYKMSNPVYMITCTRATSIIKSFVKKMLLSLVNWYIIKRQDAKKHDNSIFSIEKKYFKFVVQSGSYIYGNLMSYITEYSNSIDCDGEITESRNYELLITPCPGSRISINNDVGEFSFAIEDIDRCRKIIIYTESREKLSALISTISDKYKRKERTSGYDIYMYYDGGWNAASTIGNRTFDYLFLKHGQKEEIVRYVRSFMRNKHLYHQFGQPYKAGFIFHGPPGTGKTSLALTIAKFMEKTIFIMNAKSIVNIGELEKRFSRIPTGSVILIDDIDCNDNFHRRESKQFGNREVLQKFLELMDGNFSNQYIFILTTNYIDKLDPALIRPGRCNINMHLGLCDRYQLGNMYSIFTSSTLSSRVIDMFPEGLYSPAKISDIMFANISTPENIENALLDLINNGDNKYMEEDMNEAVREDVEDGTTRDTEKQIQPKEAENIVEIPHTANVLTIPSSVQISAWYDMPSTILVGS